jgi:hypothetical protein
MTFHSDGFCWAGSSNARQKHIFPNWIIKVQSENYNSFPNYKLFPGLKNLLKEKEHNFKILNLYWKKNCQHMVITVYIKGREMHHWSQFSQPEYVIIFQIAKTYTMSEILGRQTPTAVAMEYTVLSPHP